MAILFKLARKPLPLLKTLTLMPSRHYISEMRGSAFREKILRLLRSEIADASTGLEPSPPPNYNSFSIDHRPGEQWIRLTHGGGNANETIRIDATMVDAAAPSTRSPVANDFGGGLGARFHISMIVEVSKGEDCDFVLQFVCSAWSDSLDVDNVVPLRKGSKVVQPFMGPNFRELDEELQNAVREYLDERGVNDELAEFLHEYMEGKHKGEFVRWLKNVESYVKK